MKPNRIAAGRVLDDEQSVIDALRTAGHTVGGTRRAIVAAVFAREGTFTAEDLIAGVDGVHAATVYRTLGLLEDLGAVAHVHLTHGAAVFELAVRSHLVRHLCCEACGRDIPVPAAVFEPLKRMLESEYEFVLDSGHFAFPGLCAECAAVPDDC